MGKNWLWRTGALAVVCAALAGALVFATGGDDDGQDVSGADLGPIGDSRAGIGEQAPDFLLETPEGELVRLSDFRGKPVIVNFWASWCGPCRSEMPEFQSRYQELEGELVIVAVNVDDSLKGATSFRDEFGLTFPVVIDRTGEVKDAYGVGNGLPKSYFIDAQGVLRTKVTGEVLPERLNEELAALGLHVSEGS